MFAKYTEYLSDLMNNDLAREALNNALSTYPLYEGKKDYDLIPTREELNNKLLNHYKYHEIGFETVGRFLDELKITMHEIMPRYNEMFKTIEIMADLPNPFDNVDVTETFEETRTGTSSSEGSTSSSEETSSTASASDKTVSTASDNSETSGTSSSTANGKHIESDTPQDELSVDTDKINEVDFASKAQWNQDKLTGSSTSVTDNSRSLNETVTRENTSEGSSSASGSSNMTGTTSGTVSHTFKKVGNQGVNTYAHDMNEFRTSIIDVVDQIINDTRLSMLFMQVY